MLFMNAGNQEMSGLRVAIYRTSSLGDIILATACLDLLKHLGLDDQVVWVSRGPTLELISASYPKVELLDIGRLQDGEGMTQKQMAHSLEHVHAFIDLQGNLRAQWLGRALAKGGIKVYRAKKRNLLRQRFIWEAMVRSREKTLPVEVRSPGFYQYQLMVQTVAEALKEHLPEDRLDGMYGYRPKPSLLLPPLETEESWFKELKFGKWIAVAPGAAHPPKEAPIPVFLDILKQLKSFLGAEPVGIVFLGDEKDRNRTLRLYDQLDWPFPVLNLAGRLSLLESATVLDCAAVALTNDSVLAHVAEALETPVGVLFGPTVEGFGFAPRMAESQAFSLDIGCRPCSKHGKKSCRFGDYRCFLGLDSQKVAQFLKARLAS